MKFVLVGAVGSTAIALRSMQEAGCPPDLLVTFDSDLGPRRHSDFVDVAELATPETSVLFVDNINDQSTVARIAAEEPDVIFVIGWSQLVGAQIMSAAREYVVGFHPTALPAFRGRAALGWTILLGLEETGSTLFVIDGGVDSGPILAQKRFPLDHRETVTSLGAKHMDALGDMMRQLLPRMADGSARPVPQPDDGVSYCAKRTARDSQIGWHLAAYQIDRLIRASTRPYPGAYTFTRHRKIFIWEANPVELSHAYFAAEGQIVSYRGRNPIVKCGADTFLEIADYTSDSGQDLKGQIRFFDAVETQSE